MRPQRLQRQRTRGWRKPVNAVYVGRPSRWGNPYRVGRDGTAAACVALFRARYAQNVRYRQEVQATLAGHDVLCWCAPGAPCHADVLLQWANTAQEDL
jgi:hypothetical protein